MFNAFLHVVHSSTVWKDRTGCLHDNVEARISLFLFWCVRWRFSKLWMPFLQASEDWKYQCSNSFSGHRQLNRTSSTLHVIRKKPSQWEPDKSSRYCWELIIQAKVQRLRKSYLLLLQFSLTEIHASEVEMLLELIIMQSWYFTALHIMLSLALGWDGCKILPDQQSTLFAWVGMARRNRFFLSVLV